MIDQLLAVFISLLLTSEITVIKSVILIIVKYYQKNLFLLTDSLLLMSLSKKTDRYDL